MKKPASLRMRSSEFGRMKNLIAPLGLSGVRSHLKTDRSRNQCFDGPLLPSPCPYALPTFSGQKLAEFSFPQNAKQILS
jgi:hypothetical protein